MPCPGLPSCRTPSLPRRKQSKLFFVIFFAPAQPRFVLLLARSSVVAVEDHSFVPHLEPVFFGNTCAGLGLEWLMLRMLLVSKKASWAFGVGGHSTSGFAGVEASQDCDTFRGGIRWSHPHEWRGILYVYPFAGSLAGGGSELRQFCSVRRNATCRVGERRDFGIASLSLFDTPSSIHIPSFSHHNT